MDVDSQLVTGISKQISIYKNDGRRSKFPVCIPGFSGSQIAYERFVYSSFRFDEQGAGFAVSQMS